MTGSILLQPKGHFISQDLLHGRQMQPLNHPPYDQIMKQP